MVVYLDIDEIQKDDTHGYSVLKYFLLASIIHYWIEFIVRDKLLKIYSISGLQAK